MGQEQRFKTSMTKPQKKPQTWLLITVFFLQRIFLRWKYLKETITADNQNQKRWTNDDFFWGTDYPNSFFQNMTMNADKRKKQNVYRFPFV